MKYAVIYVPGLGDHKIDGQLKAVRTWRFYGVHAELFQMRWMDKEPWAPKFERLLTRIDELTAQGYRVGLVGASAGATAVVNAFAARKETVAAIVCIAGKVNRAHAISGQLIRHNPAFGTSAHHSQDALSMLDAKDRKKILSRYGALDLIVPAIDSHIPGARNRVVPTIGHFFTIASQIIFGAYSFIRFIKKQAQAA